MYMESRRCHKLSDGTAKIMKQKEWSGEQEKSRRRGCPHYMKNLIQIKEIRLDFKEMTNVASSKVKTYFSLRLCLWGGGGFGRFHCCIDATSPRASVLICLPVHCFPREGLAGFIDTLGRHCASDSDMTDQKRNVPDLALVNFFIHTLLYWSHSASH